MVTVTGTAKNFDFRKAFLQMISHAFGSKPQVCTAPTDGIVLKMHYKLTFWVLITGFFAVWYSWYHRDVIVCVSQFSADVPVRMDMLNICLSYPYIVEADGSITYLMFYRWIHFALLIAALMYYIPRKLSKTSENARVKRMLETLSVIEDRYDGSEIGKSLDIVSGYLIINVKSHNKIFINYLSWNFVALLIDIVAFYFFDWVLMRKFLNLGYAAFPYNRDGQYHEDYISRVFSPFVDCQIDSAKALTGERIEKIGCHLTVMELYEKLFLFLWFWFLCLIVITTLYTLFLACFFIPAARVWILNFSKPYIATDGVKNLIRTAGDNWLIGDWFLMYKLRTHFSSVGFYKLLCLLADHDYRNHYLLKMSINVQGSGDKKPSSAILS